MSSSRHANPSQKARQSRIYRRNQKEQKRFEAPLREFIEIKYKDIFEEYTELYNQMVAENPKKINLKKSKTFKRWKTTNQHSNPNDILSRAMRETLEKETPVLPEIEQAKESEAGQNQAEQSETEQQAEESEAGVNQAEQSETEQDERLLAAQQPMISSIRWRSRMNLGQYWKNPSRTKGSNLISMTNSELTLNHLTTD